MRSLRSVVVGFAASGLLLAGGLLVSSDAHAQSSSPGCQTPCSTANSYLSQFDFFVGTSPSSNLGRCRSQCGSMRKGCFNAVQSSARCLRGSGQAIFEYDTTACGDLQGSAQNSCNASVTSTNRSFENFLLSDTNCGNSSCESEFQACLNSCID